MNKILVSIVLIISLMGCASALDVNSIGQNPQRPLGTYSDTSGTVLSQYNQYFTMPTGPTPKTNIEAPKKHDVETAPTTVYFYFGSQLHAVPYSQYQTYVTNIGGNSLWIQGLTSWTQYATVPQGAYLSLMASSPTGGDGYLYEITPDGLLKKISCHFFSGYNQIGFWADTIGQHIFLFVIDDQVSGAIVVNIVGSYQPFQPINAPTIVTTIYPGSTSGPTPGYWNNHGRWNYPGSVPNPGPEPNQGLEPITGLEPNQGPVPNPGPD
jgi:hypothetical protein